MRILHMEDDDWKRDSIQGQFPKDAEVVNVKLATQLDAALSDGEYDLMVFDNMMQIRPCDWQSLKMANEAQREARRSGYTGPIVVISGDPMGVISIDDNVSVHSFGDFNAWRRAIENAISG